MTLVAEQEIKYFVDDGCNTENDATPDDIEGSYQVTSYKAGVRCCKINGDHCKTIGRCPDDATTHADATRQCADIGRVLCTKSQLQNGVCCGKGGKCDSNPVWTSTVQPIGI